jgi:diaminopimelate epimerase
MKYLQTSACENTFLLFDFMATKVNSQILLEAHKHLVKEKRDDALLLTEGEFKEGALYLKMLVLGRDGNLGEFCGNGSRTVAAYLYEYYSPIQHYFIKTKQGEHELKKYNHHEYSITLPAARFEINDKFIKSPQKLGDFQYVEMIEPHLVIEKKLQDEELFLMGRSLNELKELFPHGINVNAWHHVDDQTIFVKTYERGVQNLTRSCGTGSMSCAAISKKKYLNVKTPGGKLKIILEPKSIELVGPAILNY